MFVWHLFWYPFLLLPIVSSAMIMCPLNYIIVEREVELNFSSCFFVFSYRLILAKQLLLMFLGFRIFWGIITLKVKPTKMSSAQKVYVKLRCMLCLSRRSSSHGQRWAPERELGWLYQRQWIGAGIHGWGMPWRMGSPNGMQRERWMQGRRFLSNSDLLGVHKSKARANIWQNCYGCVFLLICCELTEHYQWNFCSWLYSYFNFFVSFFFFSLFLWVYLSDIF